MIPFFVKPRHASSKSELFGLFDCYKSIMKRHQHLMPLPLTFILKFPENVLVRSELLFSIIACFLNFNQKCKEFNDYSYWG